MRYRYSDFFRPDPNRLNEAQTPPVLGYYTPRNEIPLAVPPEKPLTKQMGFPLGIFYAACIFFAAFAPREWTHLPLDGFTTMLVCVFGVLVPGIVLVTIRKTRSFGAGILTACGSALYFLFRMALRGTDG